MFMRRQLRVVAILVMTSVGVACADGGARASSPPPANVGEVRLGRSLGEDRRVAETTRLFAPWDTFYLSVETDVGAPRARLRVRWTSGAGQVLAETEQVVGDGAAVTEFHASRSGGWLPGEYSAELFVDEVSVKREAFTVKEGR